MGLHGVALAVVIVTHLCPPSERETAGVVRYGVRGAISIDETVAALPPRRRNTTLCENFGPSCCQINYSTGHGPSWRDAKRDTNFPRRRSGMYGMELIDCRVLAAAGLVVVVSIVVDTE